MLRDGIISSVGNPEVTDEVLEWGCDLGSLQTIVVHEAPLVSGSFLSKYVGRRLQRLHLYDVPITDAACEYIARLGHLKSLVLRGCRVSQVGIRRLARCPGLHRMELTTTVALCVLELPGIFKSHTSLGHVSLEAPGLPCEVRRLAGLTLVLEGVAF